jgi:hypothetical protein
LRTPSDSKATDASLRATRLFALVLASVLLSGCAIRYDSAGTTRVGIGLWGFGDPPGVDWNLDRQNREIQELPSNRAREIPDLPRTRAVDLVEVAQSDRVEVHDHDGAASGRGASRRGASFDDNRGCAIYDATPRCPDAVAPRTDARVGGALRH